MRGGVAVAAEIARALEAPLDVIVARKLGAPFQPELAIGAVARDASFINHSLIEMTGITTPELERITAAAMAEVRRYEERFREGRPPERVEGRDAIVVDDGLATGATAIAAARTLRKRGPKRIVLAVPACAPQSAGSLEAEVDELLCLTRPYDFYAVGQFYEDFGQVADDEVEALLREAHERGSARDIAMNAARGERAVTIEAEDAVLQGDLALPEGVRGIVLFAHGSGSGRMSQRNRHVAAALRERGLATLLFDLLTSAEEAGELPSSGLRFDIPFLARRLEAAMRWTRSHADLGRLPLAYFGASTGAAAALIAAADDPTVAAIVSRGGRPDLAGDALARVRAPTLLIVGGRDREVLELNRGALERLGAQQKELVIVPGATHLFEERGALDEVVRLAADWLVRHASIAAGT